MRSGLFRQIGGPRSKELRRTRLGRLWRTCKSWRPKVRWDVHGVCSRAPKAEAGTMKNGSCGDLDLVCYHVGGCGDYSHANILGQTFPDRTIYVAFEAR